jgi:hypothetical protein
MADKVQSDVTKWLRASGLHTIKTQDALYWGAKQKGGIKVPEEPGRADMVVLCNESACFVEVKSLKDKTWPHEEWGMHQRTWASMMAFDFKLDTWLLLACDTGVFSVPTVKTPFLNSYADKLPRMAWLLPAYELHLWTIAFTERHGVTTIPYHKEFASRVTMKEEDNHDNLLEAFGHWGVDLVPEYLAFGSNFALQWVRGSFQIPSEHRFLETFE